MSSNSFLRSGLADCTSLRAGLDDICFDSHEYDDYNSSGCVFFRRRLHGRALEETSQTTRCVNGLALFRKVFKAFFKRARLSKPIILSASANSAAVAAALQNGSLLSSSVTPHVSPLGGPQMAKLKPADRRSRILASETAGALPQFRKLFAMQQHVDPCFQPPGSCQRALA